MIKKLSRVLLSVALVAGSATPALAQWATSGSNIYNTNTGNVGIGNTNPGKKLTIGNNTSAQQIWLNTWDGDKIYLSSENTGSKIAHTSGWSVDLYAGNAATGTFGNPNGVFRFFTAQDSAFQDRFHISANGNIGIGTTSPNESLSVNGAVNMLSSGVTTGNALNVGTTVKATANGQSRLHSYLNPKFDLNGKSSLITHSLYINTGTKIGTGTVDTAYGLFIQGPTFGTTNWALAAVGNVDIFGRISADWIADGNTAVYKNSAGFIGLQSSDRRLKKNITPISDSLEKIAGIYGVLFNWKNESDDAKKTVGVIAQDVIEVLPEAVFKAKSEEGEEVYGVHYEKLTALLIEGIKEQQKEINDLKQRLDALEKK